jgi:hypothetical protein
MHRFLLSKIKVLGFIRLILDKEHHIRENFNE